MTEISSLVTNDKMLLGMSVTTAISGLLLRSCHDVGAGFVLPMCTSGGGELALNAASTGHCAGCYVAAAGLIGAFAVTVRRAFLSRQALSFKILSNPEGVCESRHPFSVEKIVGFD